MVEPAFTTFQEFVALAELAAENDARLSSGDDRWILAPILLAQSASREPPDVIEVSSGLIESPAGRALLGASLDGVLRQLGARRVAFLIHAEIEDELGRGEAILCAVTEADSVSYHYARVVRDGGNNSLGPWRRGLASNFMCGPSQSLFQLAGVCLRGQFAWDGVPLTSQ